MDPANEKLLKEYGFKDAHEIEVTKDQIMKVNWPKPNKCYRLVHESWKHSMEESYFWLLNHLKYDLSFPIVHKVTDLFSASEQSSFFGLSQQRIGAQQDKISTFLGVIGKMSRELFNLVRELRILDERLGFYKGSYERDPDIYAVREDLNKKKKGEKSEKKSKAWESSEITLKGYWVDLVEQGTKNPASVYGMAREVQFTTLPDLFFSIHPYDESKIGIAVDNPEMEKAFNRKVREVLKRKLRTYLAWKKGTFEELKTRRIFTLRYTYQHINVIKLYMSYVKPYLKNIQRLQMDENASTSPDLVAAFEGSMIEIEILGQFLPKGNKKVWAVVDLHFMYRTRPSLNYNAEGYNRGPIHEGECKMTFRSYSWTQEQIDNYKKMRDHEDFALLKIIDKNLDATMEALGEDFFKYIHEAEDAMKTKHNITDYVPFDEYFDVKKKKEEEKKEEKKPLSVTAQDPFTALFGGVIELFTAFIPNKTDAKKVKKDSGNKEEINFGKETGSAGKDSGMKVWLAYNNYKKAHEMMSW